MSETRLIPRLGFFPSGRISGRRSGRFIFAGGERAAGGDERRNNGERDKNQATCEHGRALR